MILMVAVSIASAGVEDDLRDGDRHFETGDWAKAAAAFDRAIAKGPGQVSALAYGKRAAIFIIQKNYKGGLEFIAKAKLRHPNAPEVGEQEALLLWETDRRDDAIAVAEQVVSTRPETFTNQKLIGEYYAARDPQKTATAYEAYLASRPGDLESGDVLPRVRLGFAYLATARTAIAIGDEQRAQGLYGKAVTQFETVQRKHGKRPNAAVNADNGLCAAYTGIGRYDQAVTVCERVTQAPKRVDATGSAWFNLATAYLARKQTKKARTAAIEFTRVRKAEARGFILIGDTYFADREWASALDQYTRAEKLLKGDAHTQALLSIKLGKTYRRLPGGGANLTLAIEKLEKAYSANPANLELALELGGALLEAKQDAKVTALADKVLAGDPITKVPAARANVLVLAGKALFNQRKLKEARQRFESAQQLRPGDVAIQRALVLAINEQAFETKDPKAAQTLLEQGLTVDPRSPVTIVNLAVLAIERGDCDGARPLLVKLEGIRGHDTVVRLRMLARSHLCGARPDAKKAAEVFAAAEKEARKANATTSLAEIYVEWAPLTWDTDLAGAVDKLETAVQTAGQDPNVGGAAKRNLALALFRRGWKLLRDNKAGEAAADFERATRDPSILKGTEPLAFEFSHAIALLESGRAGDAAKLLKTLGAKGNQAAYLKPAYVKSGSQLFAAYALYRTGTLAARLQAAGELAKLENDPGAFGDKIRELLASAWESIAYEQWRTGQAGAAKKSIATAEKHAKGDTARRIKHDRVVLKLGKGDAATLEAMGGAPAESLVNLGIVYELLGRPKDAYDAWVRARTRGVQFRDLGKWIEAKKRIYGF